MVDIKIEKDVQRTILGEYRTPCASGNNKLFNVLKAYSSYDPEVGYC
jgi:hypothetical protein